MNTFQLGNIIYSVDMMIAYINIFKPQVRRLKTDNFLHLMDDKVWDFGNKSISPDDVMSNKKKYKDEFKKIKEAQLKYPIIVNSQGEIIDGYHRIGKSLLNNKKYINIIILDDKILKKTILNKTGNFKKVDNMEPFEVITLFYNKFCK